VGGRQIGEDEKQGRPAPVLHQPLNLQKKRKNGKKGQNMNGVPVCPGQKTENAPTWRSPSPLFGGCFLAFFDLFFLFFYPQTPAQ